MVLINYSDRHYNLVISKDHDIARYGVLSEREVSVHKNEVKHTDEHKDCKETIKNLQKQLVSLQNELREERAKREINSSTIQNMTIFWSELSERKILQVSQCI